MRIASIQLSVGDDESKDARLDRAMTMVAGCTGADLVMLPEIWASGYFSFDRYHDEAEPLDGPIVTRAAEGVFTNTWGLNRGRRSLGGHF